MAEVSAAAAGQVSKEFCRMREPKITKLRGGYSADAELMFHSWKSDILAHITDRELDNKAAIQLIKEQTLDNARREVEFQLDLCGGNISYQDLLRTSERRFTGRQQRSEYSWPNSIATSNIQRNWKKLLLMSFNY